MKSPDDSYTLYREKDKELKATGAHMLAYQVRYPKLPEAWEKD